jgi:cobalamin 5'-phosphate synthase/cobalamin synthase
MRRALAFLTPFGGAAVPDRTTMSWFPIVGAFIGAGVGAVWWASDQLWPPAVAAAVAVAADLAFTGMLHMDGLVDSADGLLPHLTRERRLEVMAEPTVGAFGVVAAATVILLRFAALTAIAPNVALLAAIWAASRTVMAVATRTLHYARDGGGLATALIGGSPWTVGAYGTVGAFALAALAGGVRGTAAVLAGLTAAAGVVAFGHRRLGGFTGDVLGAAGVMGETVALLVGAAR